MNDILMKQIKDAYDLIYDMDIVIKKTCDEICMTIDIFDNDDKMLYRYILTFINNYPIYPPIITTYPTNNKKMNYELFKDKWSITFTIKNIINYINNLHNKIEKG